jgi:hypothetical protein
MTHEFRGRYRVKRTSDSAVDPSLARLIRERAEDGRLPCAVAFAIAGQAKATPDEVGRALDLLETKIIRCQLGLFGYGKERQNIVQPAEKVSAELENAIRGSLFNGKLPCKTAWEIADRFGLSKMEITAACEKLNLRISACQLGTF